MCQSNVVYDAGCGAGGRVCFVWAFDSQSAVDTSSVYSLISFSISKSTDPLKRFTLFLKEQTLLLRKRVNKRANEGGAR